MLAAAELTSDKPPLQTSAAAEAARYTLLRRLAPSMRHHLVVNLQPIGMIYEVMDRRLRAPEPDLANVHDSAHKINGFARAALNSCLDVVSWLAPDDSVTCTVSEAAAECSGLLATSLSFRGFALRNQVGSGAGSVRRSSIRNLLTGALICITDEYRPPAELILTARALAEGASLSLALTRTDGEQGFAPEAGYRHLTWADLQALALAEGAQATREGEQGIHLLLPWSQQPAQA
jgi:hypothetical protein